MINQGAVDPDYLKQAAAVLARLGRAHLPDFLTPDAANVLHDAVEKLQWRLMYREGEQPIERDLAEFEALPQPQKIAEWNKIQAQAATGFQYLYDKYPISEPLEAGAPCDELMTGFFAALNSEPMLEYFRLITGERAIAYADAQATRYRPGHFLTIHHDEDPKYDRRYAYVLNLTKLWRPEWGGLLLFIGPDGHISEGYSPCWNALNIFKVPQPHTVSVVAPFAAGLRYAITGWLRADRP